METTLTDEVYGEQVRLKYATVVNYATKVASLVVGLLFTVFVARKLSIFEFGVWTLILKYINYITPFAVIFTYWIPRTISRGINTAKTALLLASLLSVMAFAAYIVMAFAFSFFFGQPIFPLLLASIIVVEVYIERCLNSIASAHAPQYMGFSILVFKIVQTFSAFFLIVAFKLGLVGAVIAAIIGRLASIILLFFANKIVISISKIDLTVIKDWIKKSWLPIFTSFSNTILVLDVLIVRTICGSEEPIAYYGISLSILGVTTISTYVLSALYARLLARKDLRDVVEAFWIAGMFMVPATLGIILYTEPIVAIYGVKYLVIVPAIKIFAIASILQLLFSILATTLRGLETRDFYSGNNLTATVLFKIPVVNFSLTFIYLGSLVLISHLFKHDLELLLLSWGIAYCLRFVALILAYDWLLRKEFKTRLPYCLMAKNAIGFVIASIGILATRIIYPVEPEVSIWTLMSKFAPAVILSSLSYFVLLYLVDKKFRNLLHKSLLFLSKQK